MLITVKKYFHWEYAIESGGDQRIALRPSPTFTELNFRDMSEEMAIELSLVKWVMIKETVSRIESIGANITVNDGGDVTCALCAVQLDDGEIFECCEGCPMPSCNVASSPYSKWYYERTSESAQAMVDFLRRIGDNEDG